MRSSQDSETLHGKPSSCSAAPWSLRTLRLWLHDLCVKGDGGDPEQPPSVVQLFPHLRQRSRQAAKQRSPRDKTLALQHQMWMRMWTQKYSWASALCQAVHRMPPHTHTHNGSSSSTFPKTTQPNNQKSEHMVHRQARRQNTHKVNK